jgi:hypothetical protein
LSNRPKRKRYSRKIVRPPGGKVGKPFSGLLGGSRPGKSPILFILLILALVLLPLWVYWPVLSHDFVSWDDPSNVLQNPQIRGLGLSHIQEIFSSSAEISNYYIPLTFFSYALDYACSGLDAGAFHRTNLALHILNGLLTFWFFYLLSRNTAAAFLGAAFFSVHPLNVEAVAWVSERKRLLAGWGQSFISANSKKYSSGRFFSSSPSFRR